MKKNIADDQQLLKVTITKHNKPQYQQKNNKKPNIREKTEQSKRGELENNKYEDQKVLGQNEEDKDS